MSASRAVSLNDKKLTGVKNGDIVEIKTTGKIINTENGLSMDATSFHHELTSVKENGGVDNLINNQVGIKGGASKNIASIGGRTKHKRINKKRGGRTKHKR